MELKNDGRWERLLQYSDQSVSQWLAKADQPVKLSMEVDASSTVRRVRRWENALLDSVQELLWYLRGQGYGLREVTAKRWKGGWLIILQAKAAGKGNVKGFAFGDSLTEALGDLWYKASTNQWKWRDE